MFSRIFITLFAFISTLTSPLFAAENDDVLGRFRDWYAAAYKDGGRTICYMVSLPKAEAGDYTRRGPAYVRVTRPKGDNGPDVVSLEAGYPFAEGAEIEVAIDGTTFSLFTQGETAWAYDSAGDRELSKAMASGAKMIVRGTSARGTATTDTYSLMGFSAARNAMAEACGE